MSRDSDAHLHNASLSRVSQPCRETRHGDLKTTIARFGAAPPQPGRTRAHPSKTDVLSRSAGPHEDVEPIVDVLAEQLIACWKRGDRPLVEAFLDLYPALWSDTDALIELLFEELSLRRQYNEPISRVALLARFPAHGGVIERLLACQHMLELPGRPPVRWAPGTAVGGFRIIAELGRGAHGCVMLATQAALANRPVVLKIIPADGQEHLSLARLPHTHIVPLYAVHDDPGSGTRALCMPYFGSLTLAGLLRALAGTPPAKRTGSAIIDAIEREQAFAPIAHKVGGPAFRFLRRASYVQAVCWIGACLADALHDAHERGLVHLDVKPSNVLIAADGQPMLLDFHLAREPLAPNERVEGRLGGTPAYMAPEHANAFDAFIDGDPIKDAVNGRADIYSLGVVLYEALGGSAPIPTDPSLTALRRRNMALDRTLCTLLERCLAREPDARYSNAASLASDLRRCINHLPLGGVTILGAHARLRCWRKHVPHFLLTASLLLVLASMALFGRIYVARLESKARAIRTRATALVKLERVDEAAGLLHGALALVEDLPLSNELAHTLRNDLRKVERNRRARALRDAVNRFRTLDAEDDPRRADSRQWLPPVSDAAAE